jgi:hypothetical protein
MVFHLCLVIVAQFHVLGEERENGEERRHGSTVLDFRQKLVPLVPLSSMHLLFVVGSSVLVVRFRVMPLPARITRFHEDLHEAIDYQTKALLLLQEQRLSCDELPRLHCPSQLMKDRPLQIPKDLDGTEKLVEVIGQSRLVVPFLSIGEEIDLGLFPLRLGG